MLRLVTMSKLATFITTAGLGSIPANANPLDPSFDPSQISNAITTIVGSGSPADKANIGNIAITAQTAYCNAGSSFENNEICSNLNQAIAAGAGNTQTIGEQLLALLQANN